MVHPFEEVLSGEDRGKSDAPRRSRRHLLKLLVGGTAAGVAGLTFHIQRQRLKPEFEEATTCALFEEGGPVYTDPRSVGELTRDFQDALKVGDVRSAQWDFTSIMRANVRANGANKSLVASLRIQFKDKLANMLAEADRNLRARKLVPAIKSYRAISSTNGFKQQGLAKAGLEDAARLEGYDKALKEAQAQELYDVAAKLGDSDKLQIYQQLAKVFGETPTGKKAARQARILDAAVKRNEAAAADLGSGDTLLNY